MNLTKGGYMSNSSLGGSVTFSNEPLVLGCIVRFRPCLTTDTLGKNESRKAWTSIGPTVDFLTADTCRTFIFPEYISSFLFLSPFTEKVVRSSYWPRGLVADCLRVSRILTVPLFAPCIVDVDEVVRGS